MTPDRKKLGLKLENFFLEGKRRAEGFQCVFCKVIFSDNYLLPCNHCICDYCIKTMEKCPLDNGDIIENINSFNDNFIGKELLNQLKVDCIFKKKGCNWVGNFEKFYSEHLKSCVYSKNELSESNIIFDNFKNHFQNSKNNEKINFEKYFNKNNINNNKLNKKRKLLKDKNEDNQINENKLAKKDEPKNIIKESNFSIFQNNNFQFNDNNKINDNKSSSSILDKFFFDNYINNITIDSTLTMNNYPYHYFFTEPLDDNFNCQIEIISRNITMIDEISFGLTNIDNESYMEILSTKNNIFLFLKNDIIKIVYDSNYFYINSENGKYNDSIFFENNENIKYYPTIILNNKNDILKVLHN